ncbi:serine/threonine-protein kinase Nek1-like [Cryptosporidium felis]|nr:serine/threonine-protein kinase Nek1-like [Cryptosporidium felis]
MSDDKGKKNEISNGKNSNLAKFKVGERIGKYLKVKEVGSGSYGKAVLVKDIYKGRDYVMKIINISKLSVNERRDAINEVRLLSSIRHPYIVCFKESFVDNGFLNIVMEYADGGDLFRKVNAQKQLKKNFSENQVTRWLTQALLGLAHLHNRKILHRDIKSQNIFISYSGLKIGDFGIAKVLENTGAFAKTTIGTPYYLSPEICLSKPYSWSSDVWALGCVAYEMCSLKVPFDAPNLKMLVEKITNGIVLPISNSYNEDLRKVIMDMLITDSSQRPTVMELLNYPIIEAELKKMKNEALSILKSNTVETSHLGSAASIIEIISTVQTHSLTKIQMISNIISDRPSNLGIASTNKNMNGTNEKTASRVQEAGSEARTKMSNKYGAEKSEIVTYENLESNVKCYPNGIGLSIQCNKKSISSSSKNSLNVQGSTTASYCDEKNSTADTKSNGIYKQDSSVNINCIGLFPFQVETVI